MATMKRRSLLASALVAAGATITSADSSAASALPASDATVIRLCGEYIELELADLAIYDGPHAIADQEAAEAAAAPGWARMQAIVRELGQVRAATAAGVLARVRMLAVFNGAFAYSWDDFEDHGSGYLLTCLLRDAVALGAPLPEILTLPAELRGGAA